MHGAGIDSPLVEYARQSDGSYVRSWYAADYKGSIVATTDDAGLTQAIYSYGDYGEPNTFGGPAFRYTGQRLDPDSGLYYYKARWYSPNLGRFLSTDPVGTKDDINLYVYVANDPINLSDPTGMTSAGSSDEIVITGHRGCQYCLPDTSAYDAMYGGGANVSSDYDTMSAPIYGVDPLSYVPLTPADQASMNALLSSPQFKYRAADAFNRTAINRKEHGFLIWKGPNNTFRLGPIFEGNADGPDGEPANMGGQYALYMSQAFYHDPFWADYHVHPSSSDAATGPSFGDLHLDKQYHSIGILGSLGGGVVSQYGYGY